MFGSNGITQNAYDWSLRIKILALLEQELEGLLVHGDSQIEFMSFVFLAENIDQSISILLVGVTRQVQEFKIQIVEIKSAGDKRIREALIDDFVNGLRIRKGMQDQDSFGSKINLSLGLSKPQPGTRPKDEQNEEKQGGKRCFQCYSLAKQHPSSGLPYKAYNHESLSINPAGSDKTDQPRLDPDYLSEQIRVRPRSDEAKFTALDAVNQYPVAFNMALPTVL